LAGRRIRRRRTERDAVCLYIAAFSLINRNDKIAARRRVEIGDATGFGVKIGARNTNAGRRDCRRPALRF